MKIQHVFVIGMREELRPLLTEAAREAFPEAVLTPLETFAQAKAWPDGGRGILILVEPTASLVAGAKTGLDASGLFHWPAVVVASTPPEPGVDWLGPEDWNVRTLVRVLLCAVEKHLLARDNARLRGDLLTIARRVNHDLRSSLNGVMTASEVIKEILGAERPEDLELIQPVADSAAEIARLIDQVSFVAKATAMPALSQQLPMNELMWKGISRLEALISERKAEVTHGEEWPVVFGVASWLETVWTYLILNAVEHGGAPPSVELSWDETETEQRFWVADRGPGVLADRRGALFTPFHRLAESGAARGFGLAVVQRLIDLLGGRTGYEPREGGGSRFYFTLPKRKV